MLTAPAFTQVDGVTVFGDDSLFYKYYPIAPAPSVRKDDNGRPVFLLVKYAFSDEDRQSRPDLPAGGGYLNFDIVFEVAPELLAKVERVLQPVVDATWQRLKNGTPEEQARPGVAGTTEPPRVEFGTPTWTGGKVSLDAPQATTLVSARVAEATPSLLAGNIAVFNMDLTPAGATFMQDTLVTPGGTGASDLTPLQVSYDLKFWARLPPVRIHVQADAEKIHEYVRKQMDGRGTDHCTTYEFEHTDIDKDAVTQTGAIDVQIDTGSGSLPDEVIEELRQYSLDLVKEMIEASFFTDTPSRTAGGPEEIPVRRPGENSKKYLKETYDSATMSIRFDLEQRSVIEWSIHPQATLQTFFTGMSAEELRRYVRVVDLDDEFFRNLELNVRAFVDFADRAISNVEVQVHYEGRDENGTRAEKNETFTLTGAAPAETWKVSLIGSEREYRYRYRIGFTGQEAGPYTEWVVSKSPDLNISAADPGWVEVDVLAGDVDFANVVDNVQVHLAYEDAEAGVPREEHAVILTPTKQEERYKRPIFQVRRKPVQYRTRFKLKTGEVREDGGWRDTPGRQIVVNQSFNDVLRINLLPAGDGWDDVIQASVDLRYEDPANHYIVEDTIPLRSKDEFKSWRVFLRNRDRRDFQYRTTTAFKSGQLARGDWQSSSGEATVPVVINRPGIRVRILADTLSFDVCPLTEVTFRYNAAGVDTQETFVFRDKTPQTWTIDAPEGAPVEFTYRVTHSPWDREPVTLPEVREQDTVVVLPPYRPPKGGKLSVQAVPALVDFSATPVVTIDLKYDDEMNDVHEVGSLTIGDKATQTWTVDVKDVNQKRFGYALTYFTAAGAPHTADMTFQDIPRIVIPKYPAP